MRTRLWNNLMNVRFQAFYYDRYAGVIECLDKGSAIFLATVSSTSVAAWLVWKDYPAIWATAIGFSQVIIVAKPFLPFLRKSADYKRCALELERLYNLSEKFWFECERLDVEAEYEKQLAQLRDKKHKIDTQFASLPLLNLSYLIKKSRADIDDFMNLNFPSNNV